MTVLLPTKLKELDRAEAISNVILQEWHASDSESSCRRERVLESLMNRSMLTFLILAMAVEQ